MARIPRIGLSIFYGYGIMIMYTDVYTDTHYFPL